MPHSINDGRTPSKNIQGMSNKQVVVKDRGTGGGGCGGIGDAGTRVFDGGGDEWRWRVGSLYASMGARFIVVFIQ